MFVLPRSEATFHDFTDYERLVSAGQALGEATYLIVLLGAEAGLRCGEIMALEWRDVDVTRHRLSVARSEWKGQVTATNGGRPRHVPLTGRLEAALRQARHLRGQRVVCDTQGESFTQKRVRTAVVRAMRRARRVIGRPRPRRALPSYVWAINLRYQRRIVSGVTMPATCIKTRRPSFWPRTASRRRWASVRRSGRGPRCSRRTRFSSRRYAIRSSWWRFTQPANVRTRNCSAGGMA